MGTAIITGGARGIGFGIAKALRQAGHNVAIFDIIEQALEEAGDALGRAHGVLTAKVDVTEAASVQAGIDVVTAKFGSIDILVNNAGIVRDRRLVNMTEADWDDVVSTNLKSQFLTCRAVAPLMIAQSFGRIVNISSRAWLGAFGQANYSAAKGGVVSLTRSLALEFASKGITVNAIAPGIIETPLFDEFASDVQQKLKDSVPRRRIGHPDDIARAVLFFVDAANDYVTGQLLYVCGGRSLASPSA